MVEKCRDGKCENDGIGRYKCPKCRVRYCSAACCKLHKADECATAAAEELPTTEQQADAAASVKADNDKEYGQKLQGLFEDDPRLGKLLKDPNFRKAVSQVESAGDPEQHIQYLLRVYPDFVYFADCLRDTSF